MNFLNYPETIPDSTTIWLFQERLTKEGKIEAIMQELQRQLDSRGSVVKKVLSRTQHSLPQTKELRAIDLLEIMPELDGAKTQHGPRKETSSILAMTASTDLLLMDLNTYKRWNGYIMVEIIIYLN